MTYRKKLIEVALPLEAINKAAAREKSIRHGHPSTLHLWWARRPLAACRAVLFAQLVDDPSADPVYRRADGSVDEDAAGLKRAQLFNLIEELVQWENSNNETVINAARAEIARCVASRKIETDELAKDHKLPGGETVWDLIVKGHGDLGKLRSGLTRLPNPESVNAFLAEHAPPVLDPFCGGGSIPLEAQRLGLRAYASDLNPVPVLITKALIEIPPKFAGRPPVHPQGDEIDRQLQKARNKGKKQSAGQTDLPDRPWPGASGLAEDVRYYGKWMRDEAEQRIGRLYPKVKITAEMAKDRPDLRPYVGQELTVIAWLWARTVPSPNPALRGAHVPLVRSFWLSTKKNKEAWVEPIIGRDGNDFHFVVGTGTPPKTFDPGKGTVSRKGGVCWLSKGPMPFDHIRAEGKAGRMKVRLMAIVAEGQRGRVYLSPNEDQVRIAERAEPTWRPDAALPDNPRDFKTPNYGMRTFADLFTPRQLVALTTFSDLVMEARERVLADARRAAADGWGASAGDPLTSADDPRGSAANRLAPAARSPASADHPPASATRPLTSADAPLASATHPLGSAGRPLASATGPRTSPDGPGKGADDPLQVGSDPLPAANPSGSPADAVFPDVDAATAYADAVATYLAFGVSKLSEMASALCSWHCGAEHQKIRGTFGRQAIPMVWDFAEGNVLSQSTGNFFRQIELIERCVALAPACASGRSEQADVTSATWTPLPIVVSTDPPYYDNIGYADLSDYFYVWLRKSLGSVYPSLFRTLVTPKAEELIATPYRHDGSKDRAMSFFETGLGRAFARMREAEHPSYPLTVYYAFKQAETDEDDIDVDHTGGRATASTGWETMLEGLILAGFGITGTWPMRTELGNRMVGMGSNALASSIVLVCHPRAADASMTTRKDFVAVLKKELPAALRDLQSGNIAPVDLAQAAIGPGMAVYSRYSKVVNSDGSRMPVRTALQLINQTLDEVLSELESEFDADTRWAIKWFEQHAHDEGAYGTAETLSTAMAVSVNGLKEAGLIKSGQGKVRLLRREELLADWDPATDERLTVWEVSQHLIRALDTQGESGAADLLRRIGALGETARDLAYRLYTTCERKGWAQEARAYNMLVVAWPEITRLAARAAPAPAEQAELFEQ